MKEEWKASYFKYLGMLWVNVWDSQVMVHPSSFY